MPHKNLQKFLKKLKVAILSETTSKQINEVELNGSNVEINEMVVPSEENITTNSVIQNSSVTQEHVEKNQRKRKRNEEGNNMLNGDYQLEKETEKETEENTQNTETDSESEKLPKTDKESFTRKNKKRKLTESNQNISDQEKNETRYKNSQLKSLYVTLKRMKPNIRGHEQESLNSHKENSYPCLLSNTEHVIPATSDQSM